METNVNSKLDLAGNCKQFIGEDLSIQQSERVDYSEKYEI